MHIFATESQGPRTRRSIDVAMVVGGSALLAGLLLITDDRAESEERWIEFVDSVPGWAQWLAEAVYLSAWLYFLFLLVGLGLVARERRDLLRDLLLAIGFTLGSALLLSYLVDDERPEVGLFVGLGDRAETFPALWIALLTAVHATAAPYMSRPLRRLGWTLVFLASAAALITNILLIRDVVGALLVGTVVAAFVHVLFGSPAGRPSLGRIATAAADLHVDISDLTYVQNQPKSFTVVEGLDADRRPLRVSVMGRDAASDNYLNKAWRFAWYQDSSFPLGLGGPLQIEHAALAQVLAERGGVTVFDLVTVGVGGAGDALLITRSGGVLLESLTDQAVTGPILDAVWAEAGALHEAGIAHGQLNPAHIAVDPDGRPALLDFEVSKVAAGTEGKRSDRAELLVSTALIVGPDMALGAARDALGDDLLADLLPYLQPAALTPELKSRIRQEHLSLKQFRSQAAELVGGEDIRLEELRRVSPTKVVMNVVTILAVYAVLSLLTQIDLDAVLDSIRGATWSIVLVALVLTQLTNVAQAVAVVGAAPKPLPLGITTAEQFAINFINLAIPSTAARVAMNMRFYQRFGIRTTAAATAGGLTSVSGFVVQVFLLVLLALAGDQSVDWSQLNFTGTVLRLVVFAAALGLLGLAVMFATRRFRKWFLDRVRDPARQIRETLAVLRVPRKSAQIFGGNLVEQLLYASGLTLCVIAVGGSVSLPEVIFINTIVSLFAGLMPIPGGIGVTEAGLTAGLVAAGVPEDTAFAAVIIYRLCTYYVPPIWGWFAMRWLTENDYL